MTCQTTKGTTMTNLVTLNGETFDRDLLKREAGCWLDSHRGWRIIADVVDLAQAYGFPVSAEDEPWLKGFRDDLNDPSTAEDYLAAIHALTGQTDLTVEDFSEIVHDMSDEADSWLNEHVAPEGYSFGFWEGDYVLWSAEGWEEYAC